MIPLGAGRQLDLLAGGNWLRTNLHHRSLTQIESNILYRCEKGQPLKAATMSLQALQGVDTCTIRALYATSSTKLLPDDGHHPHRLNSCSLDAISARSWASYC